MNYRNKETPFEIKSEEEWEKVKVGWWVSYICNKCGERHKKVIGNNSRKINTCLKKIPYFNKETPFEIQTEEDWKKVKTSWYFSYICNKCGEKHVKRVCELKYIKNTCLNKIPYFNKETPFEIQSDEDWKKIKPYWYVSYICNECGKRHIKIVNRLKNAKNTCLNKIPYFNKETPFEIQTEEDWKKIKSRGWWVSYICNECGERHIKKIAELKYVKNTCYRPYEYIYRNKETPFEIQTEEDWKKVKIGWYVSYICNRCEERHVKKANQLKYAKNTCLNKLYFNKETPFEIKSEEDWKKAKTGWWVSYICNECGERHIKRIHSDNRKNTCYKANNIKYTYRPTYIDQYVFAF